MSDVFISYSRKDEVFALRLAKALLNNDVSVWIDKFNIPVGENWANAIQDGLYNCDKMIVVISPDSMQSKNVSDEWQYYLDDDKQVIPVLYKPTRMHFQLSRLQYIDFFDQSFDQGIAQLFDVLGMQVSEDQLKQKRAFEILQQDHLDWETFGRMDDQLLDKKRSSLVLQYVSSDYLTVELFQFVLASLALPNNRSLVANFTSKIESILNSFKEPEVAKLLSENMQVDSVKVRVGTLIIMGQLGLKQYVDIIFDLLQIESKATVQESAVQVLTQWEVRLPSNLAKQLFEKVDDWLIKSYALQSTDIRPCALVISDGTEFAQSLGDIARETGYTTVEFIISLIMLDWQLQEYATSSNILQVYDLIILVRGDHYGSSGNEKFYSMIKNFVQQGGSLFATSWIGWETKYDHEFSDLLPFQYHEFVEDVMISCEPTDHEVSKILFPTSFSYYASYEKMSIRPGSTTLLTANDNIPIFGFKSVDLGLCYYFNTCQHSCSQPMDSPLATCVDLESAMKRTLNWIFQQTST